MQPIKRPPEPKNRRLSGLMQPLFCQGANSLPTITYVIGRSWQNLRVNPGPSFHSTTCAYFIFNTQTATKLRPPNVLLSERRRNHKLGRTRRVGTAAKHRAETRVGGSSPGELLAHVLCINLNAFVLLFAQANAGAHCQQHPQSILDTTCNSRAEEHSQREKPRASVTLGAMDECPARSKGANRCAQRLGCGRCTVENRKAAVGWRRSDG